MSGGDGGRRGRGAGLAAGLCPPLSFWKFVFLALVGLFVFESILALADRFSVIRSSCLLAHFEEKISTPV